MSIHLKFKRDEFKSSKNYGKYVALPQSQGVVDTEKLAELVNHCTTFTKGEVLGIITALVEQMRNELHSGMTVQLDGFGRFHLSAECDPVDDPDEFNVQRHVRRVRCKFVEAGKRRRDGSLERPLSSGADFSLQPEYNVDENGVHFRRRGKMR